MDSWSNVCRLLKYADRNNEMAYQKSIIDMLLKDKLCWSECQIDEQPSLQLGSTERIIPDIVITKDGRNRFVMEVKEPSHVRNQKNVNQLVSYMKQLETPVGVYVGKELEVYYKNIGDGSDVKRILSVSFAPEDKNGEDFIKLFSENSFSIENVSEFVKKRDAEAAFEENVSDLVSHFLSQDFEEEIKCIIANHFREKGGSAEIVRGRA